MWLDDTRIPFVDSDKETINFDRPRVRASVNDEWILKQAHDYTNPEHKEYNTQGRFTPNLLVCDDMLNDGTITKATAAGKKGKSGFVNGYESGDYDIPYGDKGTNSRYYDLDKWFDKVIDEIQ